MLVASGQSFSSLSRKNFLTDHQFPRQTQSLDGEQSRRKRAPSKVPRLPWAHTSAQRRWRRPLHKGLNWELPAQAQAAIRDQGRAWALSDKGPRAQQGTGHGRRSREEQGPGIICPEPNKGERKEGLRRPSSPFVPLSPSPAPSPAQLPPLQILLDPHRGSHLQERN